VQSFLKAGAVLVLGVVLHSVVRLLVRGQEVPLARLLDWSLAVAVAFYFSSHCVDCLELTFPAATRLLRLACAHMIAACRTLKEFWECIRHLDSTPDKPCICGSGRLFKNCHLKN